MEYRCSIAQRADSWAERPSWAAPSGVFQADDVELQDWTFRPDGAGQVGGWTRTGVKPAELQPPPCEAPFSPPRLPSQQSLAVTRQQSLAVTRQTRHMP